MTQECLEFEEFLWDSFCDGQTRRELRLSEEELSLLCRCYPEATYSPCDTPTPDGKCWYAVSISHCVTKAI